MSDRIAVVSLDERVQMARVCVADHDYFLIPRVTDLAKIRDEAYNRTLRTPPETSLIHHHRLMEGCEWSLESKMEPLSRTQKHEFFSYLDNRE
jgi:hypothetical protein